MGLVAAFGTMQIREPADPAVQAQVKKLQDFITENYYTCTKPILYQLGQMYGAGPKSVLIYAYCNLHGLWMMKH